MFWMADNAESGAWWQVDLEGFYQISGSKIIFNSAGNYRFAIDLSEYGADWQRAVDRSDTDNTAASRNDIYPPGATARYVRITYVATPAELRPNLVDFQIFGILSTR
jgi:hypothetical protein